MLCIDIKHTDSLYFISEEIKTIWSVVTVRKHIYDTSSHGIFSWSGNKIHSCKTHSVQIILKLIER